MSLSLVTFLFAISFLQIIWFVTYKKPFSLRESLILTFFVMLQLILSFFLKGTILHFLQTPFFIVQFIFAVKRLNNWFLPSLLIGFDFSLVSLSWFPTLDIWTILHNNHYITDWTFTTYLYLFIFLQQVLLFILIIFIRYLDQQIYLSSSIMLLPKKYKCLSISLLCLIITANSLKEINIIYGDAYSFLYSVMILIGFTCLTILNLWLINRYRDEKQNTLLLSKTYAQEKRKMSQSNQFLQNYQLLLEQLTEYLEAENTEMANQLLDSVIDQTDSLLTPNLYKKIAILDNPPVQSLLSIFLNKCLSANVQLEIEILDSLSTIDMHMIDFIRCFSILLDNAYEATVQSSIPYIKLSIIGTAKTLTIEVENTYKTDKKIAFQRFLQKNFSTKKGHQGKGLWIFLAILGKYKQSSYNFTNKNDYFIGKFTVLKRNGEA